MDRPELWMEDECAWDPRMLAALQEQARQTMDAQVNAYGRLEDAMSGSVRDRDVFYGALEQALKEMDDEASDLSTGDAEASGGLRFFVAELDRLYQSTWHLAEGDVQASRRVYQRAYALGSLVASSCIYKEVVGEDPVVAKNLKKPGRVAEEQKRSIRETLKRSLERAQCLAESLRAKKQGMDRVSDAVHKAQCSACRLRSSLEQARLAPQHPQSSELLDQIYKERKLVRHLQAKLREASLPLRDTETKGHNSDSTP